MCHSNCCGNCGEGYWRGWHGMCGVSKVAKALVLAGALNWGLIGVGMLMDEEWNVVDQIFGTMPEVEMIVYLAIGIAAVVKLVGCRCKTCEGGVCKDCGEHGPGHDHGQMKA